MFPFRFVNISHILFFSNVFMSAVDYVDCSAKGQMLQITSTTLKPYENQYGPGYGKEWIFFPDGNGTPHFVNLTESPQEEYLSYLRTEVYGDVEYRLYWSSDKNNFTILNEYGVPLVENGTELTISDKPVKIITHGWKSSIDDLTIMGIKDAYLEAQDVYVITADWSYIASSIFYHWVAYEIKTIGNQVASFLNAIQDRYNVTGDNIHLIGHSLGAHVMAVAASTSNLTIDRITGLDPARPLFEYSDRHNSEKLDSSDANFVDVMHTCAGVLGIEASIGQADYFPNNGIAPQPGCESIQKIFESCSHGRALLYFAESIKYPRSFPAYQCESWTDFLKKRCVQFGFMGEAADRNATGNFFLKTNARSPFGRRKVK